MFARWAKKVISDRVLRELLETAEDLGANA